MLIPVYNFQKSIFVKKRFLHIQKSVFYVEYIIQKLDFESLPIWQARTEKLNKHFLITAVSIMPGLVRTSLVETVFDRYPIFGRLINQAILPLISNSAEKGAKYSLFGATSPAVSPGGLYGPPGSYVAIRGPVRQITKLLTSFDRECI